MKNILLVGAGGAGVSSLGGLLLELGYTNIIASDQRDSPALQTLSKKGAKVYVGHGKYNVQPGDVVIYSAATTQSDEVQQAFSLHEENYKISPPPLLFHECMGEISKYFKTLAVTGTHGKSSTSSHAAYALQQNDPDFGVAVIGAQLVDRDGQGYFVNATHKTDIRTIFDHIFFRKGQPIGELMKRFWFVIEADEFNKHFLFLDPDYALITTCELDHLDTYGTEENYFQTFYQFMQKVRHTIYIPTESPGIQKLLTYTANKPGVHAAIVPVQQFTFSFETLLGGHNHVNASLVQAVLSEALPSSIKANNKITQSLEQFRGIKRRAELLGNNKNGIPVYSDYGHHPTELSSTLTAFRQSFPKAPIHVLFQPHQMARVVQFWEEFHDAIQPFTGESRAYSPIYAARETVAVCREAFPLNGTLKGTQGVEQLHTVSSSQELSAIFAQQVNAPLLEGEIETVTRIDSISSGIIVFFSAGSLDKVVREHILQAS